MHSLTHLRKEKTNIHFSFESDSQPSHSSDSDGALETEVNEITKDVQCDLCCKTFQVSAEQQPDILEGYQCSACNGDLDMLISMLKESRIACDSEPSVPQEVHQCDICHKCFKSAASVKKHKHVHARDSTTISLLTNVTHNDKLHQCDICPK